MGVRRSGYLRRASMPSRNYSAQSDSSRAYQPTFPFVVNNDPAITGIVFNTARPPFDLLDVRWALLLAIAILVPLLTLLSVNLGIFISTRVNDIRAAQQIGGLVVVPVVGLGIAQVTGRVVLDDTSFVQTALILAALDVIVFLLARLAFQRENILVRWR